MNRDPILTPPAPATFASSIDPAAHEVLARATASLSPLAAGMAAIDWAWHLALSPGKQLDLAALGARHAMMLAGGEPVEPLPGPGGAPDHRFDDPAWRSWPFCTAKDAFLLGERWWDAATRAVWGVEPHHEQQVAFAARQCLDVVSPGNFPFTNPTVLDRTREQFGANLLVGAAHAAADAARVVLRQPDPRATAYEVGRDLAPTPGEVVLRNTLIELIRYTPTTPTVHPEPVLIMPAWIMKYYILDLAPGSSLVRYLLDQGHIVYCISWKNPEREDAGLGMDDYLRLGWRAAFETVARAARGRRVHAVGYCLGGTLLSIGAAAMAGDGDPRLASLTLLAAQTDFSEPGELGLFIDEDQVSLLEAQMHRQGYLDGSQMAGAFSMLRTNDLVWSRVVHDYLLGERSPMNALMAWNADTTRMPATMHTQYLRSLFLHNDLAEGRYRVDGRPVTLQDLHVPVFMVGTTTDHVAPWRSVYKLHHLCPAEITFVLTSGGHNAGIVSPVEGSHRHFQRLTRPAGHPTLGADDWQAAAPSEEGSWWPAWSAWLGEHSSEREQVPTRVRAGREGGELGAAPGRYVLAR